MTAAPGGRASAAVVDKQRMGCIVTVRLDPVPTCADVVVRVAVIGGIGNICIPAELLIKLVPEGDRSHVRLVAVVVRVVIVLSARIADGPAGVCPAKGNA